MDMTCESHPSPTGNVSASQPYLSTLESVIGNSNDFISPRQMNDAGIFKGWSQESDSYPPNSCLYSNQGNLVPGPEVIPNKAEREEPHSSAPYTKTSIDSQIDNNFITGTISDEQLRTNPEIDRVFEKGNGDGNSSQVVFNYEHCIEMLQCLWNMQQTGHLCDVYIKTREGLMVFAHSIVLATRTNYFLQFPITTIDPNDKADTRTFSANFPLNVVAKVIQYIYTGTIPFHKRDVLSCYSLFEEWKIKSGMKLCSDYIIKNKIEESSSDLEVGKKDLGISPDMKVISKCPSNYGGFDIIPVSVKIEKMDKDCLEEAANEKRIDTHKVKRRASDKDASGQACVEKVKRTTLSLRSGQNIKLEVPKQEKMTRKKLKASSTSVTGKKRFRSTQAEKIAPFKCEKCENTYTRKYNLKFHLQHTHGIQDPLIEEKDIGKPATASCERCGRHFNSNDEYNEHVKECTECDKCETIFQNLEHYEDHRSNCEVEHRQFSGYKCKRCKNSYQSKADLEHHYQDTHMEEMAASEEITQDKPEDQCHRCATVIDDQNEYSEHMKECTRCYRCNQKFATLQEYDEHETSCKRNTEMEGCLFKCEDCPLQFKRKCDLGRHLAVTHEKFSAQNRPNHRTKRQKEKAAKLAKRKEKKVTEESTICEICGASCKNIKGHMRRMHGTHPAATCHVCNKRLQCRTRLKAHLIAKHGIGTPDYLCSICAYATTNQSLLNSHMFYKHDIIPTDSKNKGFVCPYCGKKTLQKVAHEDHVMKHTATERNFACPKCDRRFVSKLSLDKHDRRVHKKDVQILQCPYCPFTSRIGKAYLNQHVERLHTNKDHKPWRCEDCGFRTNFKGSLDEHLKRIHNIYQKTNPHFVIQVEPLKFKRKGRAAETERKKIAAEKADNTGNTSTNASMSSMYADRQAIDQTPTQTNNENQG